MSDTDRNQERQEPRAPYEPPSFLWEEPFAPETFSACAKRGAACARRGAVKT